MNNNLFWRIFFGYFLIGGGGRMDSGSAMAFSYSYSFLVSKDVSLHCGSNWISFKDLNIEDCRKSKMICRLHSSSNSNDGDEYHEDEGGMDLKENLNLNANRRDFINQSTVVAATAAASLFSTDQDNKANAFEWPFVSNKRSKVLPLEPIEVEYERCV